MKQKILSLTLLSLFLIPFSSAQAEKCTLSYTMTGWAAFFKSYKGEGTVSCPSGLSAKVNISYTGGGITFGSYEITEGKGTLFNIKSADDIYSSAFAIDGDAGFGKAIEGRWTARGSRSLVVSGKGRGYNVGWSMGNFKISKP